MGKCPRAQLLTLKLCKKHPVLFRASSVVRDAQWVAVWINTTTFQDYFRMAKSLGRILAHPKFQPRS